MNVPGGRADDVNGPSSPVLDADVVALHDGTMMVVHPASRCGLGHCVIHNPSPHPLNTAPLIWDEALHLMFRRCAHGSVHPDPDSLDFLNFVALMANPRREPTMLSYDGWHPCCDARCCVTTIAVQDNNGELGQ